MRAFICVCAQSPHKSNNFSSKELSNQSTKSSKPKTRPDVFAEKKSKWNTCTFPSTVNVTLKRKRISKIISHADRKGEKEDGEGGRVGEKAKKGRLGGVGGGKKGKRGREREGRERGNKEGDPSMTTRNNRTTISLMCGHLTACAVPSTQPDLLLPPMPPAV